MGKTAHRGHLVQRIPQRPPAHSASLRKRRITQVIPLLKQMNPQHRLQQIGRPTRLTARLGVVRFDPFNQRLPGKGLLHLGQKALAPGALLGRGLLVITESELLVANHFSAHL